MQFSELSLLLHYPYAAARPVLVDVGGHQGFFSREFARRGWRVLAFEPEQANRAAFERNLAGYPQVTCLPVAVSATNGERVPFYISSDHHGIHALRPFHETHQLAYEVETITLDEALRQQQIERVTLLKIDIEGADFLALKGFDVAAHRPELVMLEFMDSRSQEHYGYTHHDVVAHMDAHGYQAFVSEWAPIVAYARAGEAVESHTWLRCQPYPLDHEPAWGNLIFVPRGAVPIFQRTLAAYLRFARLKHLASRIPGARRVYRLLRRS
jgi:methyltransferase, FkbM family